MEHYIEEIINKEQIKLATLICKRYGNKGNFNLEDIVNKFLLNKTMLKVNDEFKVPGKRGRPRKTTE
jgi:hypothetical protein